MKPGEERQSSAAAGVRRCHQKNVKHPKVLPMSREDSLPESRTISSRDGCGMVPAAMFVAVGTHLSVTHK